VNPEMNANELEGRLHSGFINSTEQPCLTPQFP
jgi:hypothetical protein